MKPNGVEEDTNTMRAKSNTYVGISIFFIGNLTFDVSKKGQYLKINYLQHLRAL